MSSKPLRETRRIAVEHQLHACSDHLTSKTRMVQACEKEFRKHYMLLKGYVLRAVAAPAGVPNLNDHRVACLRIF